MWQLKTLNGFRTDVTVDVWSTTLGVIVRHEQALETVEISDAFCGPNVHAAIIAAAGVTACRFCTRPAVAVNVAVAVGTVISLTTCPVVIVVVVVTVLSSVKHLPWIWNRGLQTFC